MSSTFKKDKVCYTTITKLNHLHIQKRMRFSVQSIKMSFKNFSDKRCNVFFHNRIRIEKIVFIYNIINTSKTTHTALKICDVLISFRILAQSKRIMFFSKSVKKKNLYSDK